MEAGTSGVTGPKKAFFTISALWAPSTTTSTLRAAMMVPMPMVYAWRGTSSMLSNRRLFAWMVLSVRSTQCVAFGNVSSGSLKPIWPFGPRPRSCKSMPPASAMACS